LLDYPAAFARAVPMPLKPNGPHVSVTITNRIGRGFVTQLVRGPVITALKLIALRARDRLCKNVARG
jgi:hypothetical protein